MFSLCGYKTLYNAGACYSFECIFSDWIGPLHASIVYSYLPKKYVRWNCWPFCVKTITQGDRCWRCCVVLYYTSASSVCCTCPTLFYIDFFFFFLFSFWGHPLDERGRSRPAPPLDRRIRLWQNASATLIYTRTMPTAFCCCIAYSSGTRVTCIHVRIGPTKSM